MQCGIGQWTQRLLHESLENMRAEALAALAEGGIGERHAKVLAQALRGATGKRQAMRHQTDADLLGSHLAALAFM